jgi:hypothetical protein
VSTPAGPQWCSQFPTSTLLDDLVQPFQNNCRAFIAALKAQGANVEISATYRPVERAALMHWCCMIAPANGEAGMDPDAVPLIAGVDIEWNLGNPADSIAAARAMRERYGIVYPAALVSRHTQRLAIDMTITGDDIPQGQALYDWGAKFGVIKLPLSVLNDPPHWSSDGH